MSETSKPPAARRGTEAAEGRSRWRRLAIWWAGGLGVALAGALLLTLLGPPGEEAKRAPGGEAPAAHAAPSASQTGPATASVKLGSEISVLLSRAKEQIAKGRDRFPPGDNAMQTLQLVAEAMPKASAGDRKRASEMASRLYDRAQEAADAGKIDEEQRLLALGSILARPPDIRPKGAEAPEQAAPTGRSAVTPAEANAVVGAPDAQAVASPPDATAATAGTGPNILIHFLAGSASAEADAKQLAARLGPNFGRTETDTESQGPPAAVIRYSDAADHAAALDIGRMLGGMGYAWHLEHRPTEPGSAPGPIEVWMPAR